MESYLALYEIRPRWRVVYVYSFYVIRSTVIFVWNLKREEKDFLNSQGDTVIEKKLDEFLQEQR